jgi:hypothetical protein
MKDLEHTNACYYRFLSLTEAALSEGEGCFCGKQRLQFELAR